jgi:very-short-patch-repair endonuclease
MKRNSIIPYNPELKKRARLLRSKCTPSESELWSKIRRKSLGFEFHRQVPVDEFIVDFYCHELRLAIEIDGSVHDSTQEYDLWRQRKLEKLGVVVIRFDNEDVKKGINEVISILVGVIEEIKLRDVSEPSVAQNHSPFEGGRGDVKGGAEIQKHPPGPLQRGNGSE